MSDTITPCAATPLTPGVVAFDPTQFKVNFPSFSTVGDAALQFNFTAAGLMLNNSCCSVVRDAPTRAMLLDLLTAHITALLNGINGAPPQGIVGRIASATEGSVTVAAEYASTTNDSLAYYSQTPWGAQYWQSTIPYRTARYIAPRRRGVHPGFGRGIW